MARKRGTCVYCGRRGKMQRDHIPPQCMFGEPYPPNLYTVPTCAECHASTHLDDEYFHAMFSMRHDTHENPDVAKTLPNLTRALQRPDKIGFARAIVNSRTVIETTSPGGIYLGRYLGYNVELPRLNTVAKRITRALYWREHQTRLPTECDVHSVSYDEWIAIPDDERKEFEQFVAVALRSEKRTMGNVLSYHFAVAADNPNASIWVLHFYEKYSFVTFTGGSTPAHRS